ncbi:MAG: alkaline phosphatase family protein [Acidobacteriota bacterium]|nr:alkaline phosphatase family protein [Acidobacteriota bacterium]
MRKLLVLCLLLTLGLPAAPASAQAYQGRPKLVLLLIIDQFRGDYLDRYRDALTAPNGFNLFLRRGAYFSNCYFDYANTKTAPGHATIGTGAYSDGHGIASNEWWDLTRNTDRVISSVEDERYRLVGAFDDLPPSPPGTPQPTDPRIGASPRNLLATTLGDEVRLATGGRARLFGISLKDRASILPSGQTANAAYWIDQATGRFVTSTFYMPQLPAWVKAFNRGARPAQAIREAGLEGPTTQFYALVGRTPAANSYELDFAQALIQNEKLGTGPVTDVLTVSLSANDILGHQLGPDADSERAMVLALDRQLDAFFTALDTTVGLANVTIAFTADHGVAPIPATAAALGINAARIDLDALSAALDTILLKRLAPAADPAPGRPGVQRNSAVHFLLPTQELPYLQLNPAAFGTLSEREAEQAVADALPEALRLLAPPALPPSNNATRESSRAFAESRLDPTPAFAFIRGRVDLADGKIPATEFGRLIAHSFSRNGGWYVMAVPIAYQMELLGNIQTTHFSPWSYDRHVPLGFFGAAFSPGIYRQPVAPVDIAATLASLLGVNRPSAAVGQVVTFALKPTP